MFDAWFSGVKDSLKIALLIKDQPRYHLVSFNVLYAVSLSLVALAWGMFEAELWTIFVEANRVRMGFFVVSLLWVLLYLPCDIIVSILALLWLEDTHATKMGRVTTNWDSSRIKNVTIRSVIGIGVRFQAHLLGLIVQFLIVHLLSLPQNVANFFTTVIFLIQKSSWSAFLCHQTINKRGLKSKVNLQRYFYLSGFGFLLVLSEKIFLSPWRVNGFEMVLFPLLCLESISLMKNFSDREPLHLNYFYLGEWIEGQLQNFFNHYYQMVTDPILVVTAIQQSILGSSIDHKEKVQLVVTVIQETLEMTKKEKTTMEIAKELLLKHYADFVKMGAPIRDEFMKTLQSIGSHNSGASDMVQKLSTFMATLSNLVENFNPQNIEAKIQERCGPQIFPKVMTLIMEAMDLKKQKKSPMEIGKEILRKYYLDLFDIGTPLIEILTETLHPFKDGCSPL